MRSKTMKTAIPMAFFSAMLAFVLTSCDAKSSSAPTPAETKSDSAKSLGTEPAKTEATKTPTEVGKTNDDSTEKPDTSKAEKAKDLLAANARLGEIIANLPKSQRVSKAERGFWLGESFSPSFEKGVPAVRMSFASKESKILDASKPSGYSTFQDEQSVALVVIHTERNTNSLFEHLANEMAERGFKEGKLTLIGKSVSEDDKITYWSLNEGAIYLARLDDMVLYALERDSGKINSGSFGAQQIFSFKELWRNR